ncbi:MAG: toll/interleukin-1 receptor domain-containing protein [Bacteroides pyogenes]|uniref:toll/interleukin-1 receptor domain-containing protein n=1 Tax=Bacteroides pyogenes TaxID=310300 RepID=UPI00242DF631|nr:toll/interleukin-1 receptor domain-containing protein [Bacteroides pyogenes]MCI7069860.1 toll/interleukin-1 receptor domain-containing protein [Bacteroides pyogenes]
MNIAGKLEEVSKDILSYFKDYKVGQGLFLLRTLRARYPHLPPIYHHTINVLIFNGFIYTEGHDDFFKLGQNGFDYFHGDEPLTLSAPPFSQLLYLTQIKNKGMDFIFNELWSLIGNENDALFYVDGRTYYDTIRVYIQGSYPTYSDFIEYLKKNNQSTSRIKWYRMLFSKLQDENLESFVNQLSDAVNSKKELEAIDVFPTQSNSLQEASKSSLNSNTETDSSVGGITIFISYAWDEHKETVHQIATRLQEVGIGVRIDKDVPYGTDLVNFMNKEIKECTKCLVFLTPRYREKAELPRGGVAHEGRIISREIYNDQDTTKFIPVLLAGSFDSSTPDFLLARKGFDFVSHQFDEEIDRMIEEFRKLK